MDAHALPDLLFARIPEGAPRRRATVGLLVVEIDRPARVIRERCAEGDVFALFDPATDPDEEPLAAAVVLRAPDGRVAAARLLAVDPDYRGAGLGTRLVQQLADSLRADGVRCMTAGPDDVVADTAAFLARVGFSVTDSGLELWL